MSPEIPLTPAAAEAPVPASPADFIRDVVANDVASGKYSRIHTRFPPEPNGYLHIGHAKSICLNFGIAHEFGGICNLRMDDTNPSKEDTEYVDSITYDVKWLIGGWADSQLGLRQPNAAVQPRGSEDSPDFEMPAHTDLPSGVPLFASAYFGPLHDFAVRLIKRGKAYVCDLSPEETEAYRGSPDKPGKDSPWRNRTVEENLDLFARMRAGEFPDGSRTLRAKIDMASPNIWLRDPLLYRVRHTAHHQTGDTWCIYPLYDFAHCLSDYIEGITHSICTLEFEVHRPLYNWILENLDLPRPLPHQYEFARLNLTYTVMSKRKLLQLVKEGHVSGWDDPRMPTISGMRRRGFPAEALRNFAYHVGITKFNALTDFAVLEHEVRSHLNRTALRRFAVLDPVRVVITNFPENQVEELPAANNPENPADGSRLLPFSRELFIDAADFMEVPPPKYFRLRPGGEVRLKYAYIIRCDSIVRNADGTIKELLCTADLESRSGGPTSGRKVKGTIHWVSAPHAVEGEVRLYDRLFTEPEPDSDGDFVSRLNPDSLRTVIAKCEPSLAQPDAAARYQFERLAYFAPDADSTPGRPVFNRVVTLKDAWAKQAGRL